MSRRLVPWAFWTSTLVIASILFVQVIRSARSESPCFSVDISGNSTGFFQLRSGGETLSGLAEFEITQQSNRRYFGELAMISDQRLFFNAINFTLARSEFFVGTGVGTAGRFVMEGELAPFDGGAVISETAIQFLPPRSRPIPATTLALRGYDAASGPPVLGNWAGSFQSRSNQRFGGTILVEMNSSDSLSFQGRTFFGDSLEFDHFGTINEDNHHFVLIGQGANGRLLAEGVFSDDGSTANAKYKIIFNNDRTDTGSISNLTPQDVIE